MEDELAVKLYQISSSGVVRQDVPGVDAVALRVEALTEAEQLVPKGVVVMGVAPLQSSLAGACANV